MSEVEKALQKLDKNDENPLIESKEKDLINKLQDEIQCIRDSRCEERFIWSFAILLIFNVAVVAVIKVVPVSLLILEFIFLWVLSTHLGVERIQLCLRELYEDGKNGLYHWVDKKYEKKKD